MGEAVTPGEAYVLPTYIEFIRQELNSFMSVLSEMYHCAGWCSGIEYELWHAIAGTPLEFTAKYSAYELSKLRTLSEAAGGWCTFDGFVPHDEWLAMLATEEGK